jgi:hypothetical protein
MTELEMWEAVNASKTVEELKEAITKYGNITISTGEVWTPEFMNSGIDLIVANLAYYNRVTRKFGIRQQLYFLLGK